VEKAALFMEKCNVIPVILAFSRKKAFNYERARKVRAEERRTVFFLHFALQNEFILNVRNSQII
jgi:hypothetical protein